MLRKKKSGHSLDYFPPPLLSTKSAALVTAPFSSHFCSSSHPSQDFGAGKGKACTPVSQHLRRGGCSFWGSASQSSGLFQHCFEIISKLATLSTKPRFALFHGKNFFPFWLKGLNLDEEGKARNSDYFFLMKKYKQLSTTSSFMLDKTDLRTLKLYYIMISWLKR